MFKLVDGRECLYQWDLDRQITVDDSSITEVHFCNRTDDCSLVVEVKDGLADVPNILLQSSFDIRVFGYDGKATLHEKTIKVKPRTKPADYIYTETEVRSYDYLENKLNEIENAGYATEDYVDNAIADIELPEGGDVDLSDYYTKEEVDDALGAVQYATEIYRLVKPDSEPTPDSMDGDMVQITDAHTIEYLNRVFSGEAVLGYTWKIGLNRFLITDFVKSGARLTLKAHRLATYTLNHYVFYLDKEDDGNWYWVGYKFEEYDIKKATEEAINTALDNVVTAEGGNY